MTHRPTRIVILALLLALGAAAIPTSAGAAPSFVDTQVKANILLLRGYIDEYAIKNSFTYPSAAMVKKGGGLVPANGIWPANPWTGRTMVAGKTRGNYTYRTNGTRTSYALVGHLSSSRYQVTGGVPAWLLPERVAASKAGLALIGQYVNTWTSTHGLPTPQEVTSAGPMAVGIPIWPVKVDNVLSPMMAQGTGPGQFSYVKGTSSGYTLRVQLASGSWSIVVP